MTLNKTSLRLLDLRCVVREHFGISSDGTRLKIPCEDLHDPVLLVPRLFLVNNSFVCDISLVEVPSEADGDQMLCYLFYVNPFVRESACHESFLSFPCILFFMFSFTFEESLLCSHFARKH